MINRKAQKYKVAYYPRENGNLDVKYKYFNCVSKAQRFASMYPSTLRIGHHYLNDHGRVWCEFHQRVEPTA